MKYSLDPKFDPVDSKMWPEPWQGHVLPTGGQIAGSLAVVSDAAHILVDLTSFLISLFSLWLASKPPTKQLTFGWHRAGSKWENCIQYPISVSIWFHSVIVIMFLAQFLKCVSSLICRWVPWQSSREQSGGSQSLHADWLEELYLFSQTDRLVLSCKTVWQGSDLAGATWMPPVP